MHKKHFAEFARKQAAGWLLTQQFKTAAFSLVEMLMALLVASLLMAALAPVMTKKINERVNIAGLGSVIFNTGKAVYNAPGEYTFVVPDNVYELKIQAAAGGGGGGGANSTSFTREWTNERIIAKSANVNEYYANKINYIIPIQKGWYATETLLMGQGGPGGYAYGKYDSSQGCDTSKGFRNLPNMADSGRDLCYMPIRLSSANIPAKLNPYLHIVDVKKIDTFLSTCWVGETAPIYGKTYNIPNTEDPRTRTICTRGAHSGSAAKAWLLSEMGYGNTYATRARMLTTNELNRIIDRSDFSSQDKNYLGPKYLDIPCYACPQNSIFPNVSDEEGCQGLTYCNASTVLTTDGFFQMIFNPNNVKKEYLNRAWLGVEVPNNRTGQPRLVYEVTNWTPHTGGGGTAGFQAEGIFKVSKNDVDSKILLALQPRVAPRQIGEAIVQGTGASEIYYYVNNTRVGGFIAYGGTYADNANTERNALAFNSQYYNYNCSTGDGISNVRCGYAAGGNNENAMVTPGVDTQGGDGIGGAQGGTPLSPKGQDGAQYGYGGGGGACAQEVVRKANGSVDIEQTCYPGGIGGKPYAKLTFKLASAGSGGGAGGAVGLTNKGEAQYLRLKVQPKDVIKITVGKGGAGGAVGRGGEDGTDTIIEIKNNKKIIFNRGKGGGAGIFQNITVDSLDVKIAEETVGGLGGNYPDFENFNEKKDGSYKETVVPITSSLSTKGYAGSTDIGGYSGGEGGTTALGYKGGCGGRQQSIDEKGCKIDDINGIDAQNYNPVSNTNGGGGGGGGGIDPDKAAENNGGLGIGGAGANGFVVIEWLVSNE